ncbi:hypothetical protein [Thalassovita aquimarina]|uniref:Uncharacterized protein n=1 Tax=Thalassovita aquimarina TaxID=2785917 RepID=A0ABS5HN83_9RHOB|nr:hypothetical protein [Thalassovita aquimarina]MBR9650332.1 hypothetical protein [Thalassovita aquimarina]
MTRHSMYLYPWDLRDEGAQIVADRLRAAGIDSITLATSYHSGKFLRPHSPKGKVYFPEAGTVYFPPNAARYGRLASQRAQLAESYDALHELACHAPDLKVTAWTVGLHNSRLGKANPELTAQTVYGDPLINSLCPAQPEVQHYLIALCADTAAQEGVREIALETPGWQAFRHGHHHEFELIELHNAVQTMLGTCFCPACRKGVGEHGLDMGRLAQDTVTQLDRFFATGAVPGTDPATDPDWQALHEWRAGVVADLVAEIRATLPNAVKLAVIPTTQTPNSLCWIEGSDLSRLAAAADRLELPAYQCGVEAIENDAAEARNAAGAEADLGFILRPTFPHLTDAADVARAVQALRRLNPASVSFYNYGHFRLQSLDWIAAALA